MPGQKPLRYLFREVFKARSETFTKPMGRTRAVVRGHPQ